ncbi:MAG TPA: hypothetical protein VII18_21555 [Mycobacterium sp.]
MIKLITVVAGLAFASIGLATPAQADTNQDQEFYRELTRPNQDHPMVVWDFAAIRSEGIASCQQEDAGATPMRALDYLDRRYGGPYTFDEANNITSSAGVIYCPWHDAPVPAGAWATSSDPVYPRPVYPPLAWYPRSMYPPPSTTVATVDPGSLAVGIPTSHPACDASGIVVLGSAVTPGRYDADVQRLLADNPGSSYLRTDESCPSLRQTTGAGNPIYAVYRVAGRTPQEVCSAVGVAGGNAYGKWLDNHTDPSYVIPC